MDYIEKLTSEEIYQIGSEFILRTLKIAVNNSNLADETRDYINAISSQDDLIQELKHIPLNANVALALNQLIQNELDKVQDGFIRLTSTINNEEERLAKAISLSLFQNHLSIFFKISKTKYSQEFQLKTAEKLGYLLHTQKTLAYTIPQWDDASNLEELTDPLLLEYADTGFINRTDADGQVKKFSLFIVTPPNSKGEAWLTRLADVNTNSYNIELYKATNDIAASFLECQSIYLNNGPMTPGTYGIWSWIATPNKKNPDKAFVRSYYESNLNPIELVQVNARNIDDLMRLLKEGIKYDPISSRTMFHTNISSKKQFTGVLCNKEHLIFDNGIARFTDDNYILPVYRFRTEDIVELNNGIHLYKKLFAGVPKYLRTIKPYNEIVNQIIKKSCSWSVLKSNQYSKADFKKFHEVLSIIPQEHIIDNIAESCACDKDKAALLLSEFMSNGQICSDLASLSEKEHEVALLKEEIEVLELCKKDLEKRNREQEELAKDIQDKISQRIEEGRKDAASFIASMAFTPGYASVNQSNRATKNLYSISKKQFMPDGSEPKDIWDDVIDEVSANLFDAGVNENSNFNCSKGLATFLCAAYILKQPILLAGPNAKQIAESLCYVVDSGRYGVLNCAGEYDQGVVNKIGKNGEKIVLVNNLITSNWANHIQDVFANDQLLYIATHPYKEDLQVEPSSLFNYMIPVLTEFMVVDPPSKLSAVSTIEDSLQDYKPVHRKRPHRLTSLQRFNASPLQINCISNVFEIMNELDSIDKTTNRDNASSDVALVQNIISKVSLAYISQAFEELHKDLSDPENTSVELQKIKDHLSYILE